MVITHAGANLAIRLESAGWSQHLDTGRFEWIFGWKDDSTPKLSPLVGGVGGTTEDIVPLENVRFSGTGKDEWRRRFVEVDEFLHETFVSLL